MSKLRELVLAFLFVCIASLFINIICLAFFGSNRLAGPLTIVYAIFISKNLVSSGALDE